MEAAFTWIDVFVILMDKCREDRPGIGEGGVDARMDGWMFASVNRLLTS
jgi:hypothetical protein